MPKDWDKQPSRHENLQEFIDTVDLEDDGVCKSCDGVGTENENLCKNCNGHGTV